MKFRDIEVEQLDLTKVEEVFRLIVKYLCGEKYYPQLSQDESELLGVLVANANAEGINYEQFNELLLLLNQDRVARDFFGFFFEKDRISFEELRQGVIKFRGFAMLCFGNFRFAYEQLTREGQGKFKQDRFEAYCTELTEFRRRPPKMIEIDKIERNKTWCVGEVSGASINKEAAVLTQESKRAEKGQGKLGVQELQQFAKTLVRISEEVEETERKALKNTDIYLTWDYMDIYVATSMRYRWEFEETYDFIEAVFGSPRLQELNLRYFDPTQSKCRNPRDKGLIEGLMLKRARCTIYLAQESDTMGKDSELAATLAQSKPVIAYVPKYDARRYSEKIQGYPLDFFKKRLLILNAEGLLSDPEFTGVISAKVPDFEDVIDDYLDALNTHRQDQPFTLWTEKDAEFKRNYKDFPKVSEILAIAECYNFDRRAGLLIERHPLAIQVDLQFGVGNGVLVVRKPSECVELLCRILGSEMEFTIKHSDAGFTVLEEAISKSPFRVVTDYERLTNSFWNLFA